MFRLNVARYMGMFGVRAMGNSLVRPLSNPLASLAVIVFGCMTSGCGKPLSQADCEALLTRYVALLAASDRPESSTAERFHMQDLAKSMAARDPEFGACGKSISRSQYQCAMSAPSTDEFERCLM